MGMGTWWQFASESHDPLKRDNDPAQLRGGAMGISCRGGWAVVRAVQGSVDGVAGSPEGRLWMPEAARLESAQGKLDEVDATDRRSLE